MVSRNVKSHMQPAISFRGTVLVQKADDDKGRERNESRLGLSMKNKTIFMLGTGRVRL